MDNHRLDQEGRGSGEAPLASAQRMRQAHVSGAENRGRDLDSDMGRDRDIDAGMDRNGGMNDAVFALVAEQTPPSHSLLHSPSPSHSHSVHAHSHPHSHSPSHSPPQPYSPSEESQGPPPGTPLQNDLQSLLHKEDPPESILHRVGRALGARPWTLLQGSAVCLLIGAIVFIITRLSPAQASSNQPSPSQLGSQASTPAANAFMPPHNSPPIPTQPMTSRTPPSTQPPLPLLPQNRPFKVLILADLHYGEAQDTWWGPAQDVNSTRVIESVLTTERPDFVVLLGDLVTGEDLVNATNATAYSDQLLGPIVTRGIPFASTYGNHDISNNLPRDKLYLHEKQYSLSYTERSDPRTVTGVTNYALQFRPKRSSQEAAQQLHADPATGTSNSTVPSSASVHQAPAFQFVFLDSNGVTGLVDRTGVPDVDWVTESQVDLLRGALHTNPTTGTGSNSTVPSYVFVHIPPPQFRALPAVSRKCIGLKEESDIGVQREDRGLWDALYSSTNVVAVFSGHDHGSGWCCPTERGVPFTACFARHSGYGGYGSWARGARVVFIDAMDPRRLETWVRMEDGSVVDRFVQESS